MHAHLEIIMPPTDKIEEAIAQIMRPFNEQPDEEDAEDASYGFWDWYVIGGRWAGAKLETMFNEEQKNKFFEELTARGVTVSGLRAGKQQLEPASQIPMVDALFNEYFPESPVKVCPFFKHFNDQYKHNTGFPDVMQLKDIPAGLTASRVIIAGPHWDDESGGLEAKCMQQDSFWNGVSFNNTDWDGKVQSVIDAHVKQFENANPEYAAKHGPQPDWLVVTVDYHS